MNILELLSVDRIDTGNQVDQFENIYWLLNCQKLVRRRPKNYKICMVAFPACFNGLMVA